MTENDLQRYYEALAYVILQEESKLPPFEIKDYVLEVSPHDYGILTLANEVKISLDEPNVVFVFGLRTEVNRCVSVGEIRIAHKVKTRLSKPR